MTVSIAALLFVVLLVVSCFLMKKRYATDEEKEEIKIHDFLSKLYTLAVCVISAAVGLLLVFLNPNLFSLIPVKTTAATTATETVVVSESFGFLLGGGSLSVVFEILFANAIMVLCFIALPMMVGIGFILLCPTFVATGKTAPTHNKYRKPAVYSAAHFKRSFLIFSNLRN